MLIDTRLVYASLREVPAIVEEAEHLGFDGLWVTETDHDPFLGIGIAATASTRITLGTSVALAFTRSPTTLAYTSWDLASLSGGRFVLGLGTQIKAHITRRFGMPWDPPAPKMREVVTAIREVWAAWSEHRPLHFRGRYYNLSLMTPFFTPPGPTPPPLRIEIAGVGPRMCRLAGEVADGFHVHPFHTRRYLRDVALPGIAAGLARSGRPREHFSIAASVLAAVGDETEVRAGLQDLRRHLSFYASTPAYRPVLDLHGWGEVGERLSRLAAQGNWHEMPGQIPDEMLESCAVWGPPDDVAARLGAEYGGLVDRLGIYEPLVPGHRSCIWRAILAGLRQGG